MHVLVLDGCDYIGEAGVVTASHAIERVGRGKSFMAVDAYRSDEGKEQLFNWNLTAKTVMSCDEWVKLAENVGYTGDY